MSDFLQPCGLQHTRLPCPSPTTVAYLSSCPACRWCHPTISSSNVPFSPHLQFFPVLGSFPISRFFTSGGQSIGVSVSASVLPMNTSLGLNNGLDLLAIQVILKSLLQHMLKSINYLALSFLYSPALTSIHDHWKNHSFD